jgi:hypothetical protein
MNASLPRWALRAATPDDHGVARDAHRLGRMDIKWPDRTALRGWARRQGWSTPWFGFEEACITKLLGDEECFKRAINESGIEITIPKRDYTISVDKLRELDALYEEQSTTGQPRSWGFLVEELRNIRRAVEAGVVVNVAGTQALHTWQDFYGWAHGRYYLLEEGYDHWIGDDES